MFINKDNQYIIKSIKIAKFKGNKGTGRVNFSGLLRKGFSAFSKFLTDSDSRF